MYRRTRPHAFEAAADDVIQSAYAAQVYTRTTIIIIKRRTAGRWLLAAVDD